jgi:uncharacterized membrane protein YoaK (UPF0700 family)
MMSAEPAQTPAADRFEQKLRRTIMPDRVVDLAAQHATPALLAVRDWLLVALAFATGIYEGISFLTFGKVFSAAQTGNIVLLGIGARTHEPAGPNEATVAIALAAWFVGAALAMPILKRFEGDRETEGHNVFQVWPRRMSIVLVIALILQAGFLVVWVTAASPATLAYPLMAMSAFAMGLQMNAIRALHVPGISVTALYRHLRRLGRRRRQVVAHGSRSTASGRDPGGHCRRRLARRLDARSRASLRTGRADDRDRRRHLGRTCTLGPSWPSATSPISDSTSHCSSTGMPAILLSHAVGPADGGAGKGADGGDLCSFQVLGARTASARRTPHRPGRTPRPR